MKINNTLALILAIALSEAAGIIGSIFTSPSIPNWYATLSKPVLTPTSWVFAPVWTFLFALMGIAAFLIWKQGFHHRQVKTALQVFLLQLVLNTLWSFLFFGLKNPGVAFMEIIILWFAILATMTLFSRLSRAAALLLVPYLLWVTFAAYLNYSIWQMNL